MTGSLTTYDLIDSRFQYPNIKLRDMNAQDLQDMTNKVLASHNAIMRSLTGELAEYTTARDAMYGGGDATAMMEVDEMGTAPPTKTSVGSVVGFPLKRFEKAWQGSRKWIDRATVGEFAVQLDGMRQADRLNIIRQCKLAMFIPTNYTSDDPLVDHRSATPIAVKRLVNADSAPIPPDPNGVILDASTHTHYLGTSSLSAANIVALIETVLEHYPTGTFALAIHRNQVAAIKGFTSNFVAAPPPGIIQSTAAPQYAGDPLMLVPTGNREIGQFDGIPVRIKPWVPAGYIVCYMLAGGSAKVLKIRVEDGVNGAGELQLDASDTNHPLRADTYSREFGVGVHERTGCAILDCTNSSYTAPSI